MQQVDLTIFTDIKVMAALSYILVTALRYVYVKYTQRDVPVELTLILSTAIATIFYVIGKVATPEVQNVIVDILNICFAVFGAIGASGVVAYTKTRKSDIAAYSAPTLNQRVLDFWLN